MKKTFLFLCFVLLARVLPAQVEQMSMVVLPGLDGFALDGCNREIGSGSQGVHLVGYWSESEAELEEIVGGALALSGCDWLTLTSVSKQMVHGENGYMYVTHLNFRAKANSSLQPRMVMFICPDYTGTALYPGAMILQAGGGSDLEVFRVSCGTREVFPGLRVHIVLSGSEAGVSYSLRHNGEEVMRLAGTGSGLTFTLGAEVGVYEVYGERGGDVQQMDGEVVLNPYAIVDNVAFMPKEVVFPAEGGELEVQYMAFEDENAMYEILDACNAGDCVTWDAEVQCEISDYVGVQLWSMRVTAPANETDTTRVCRLVLGALEEELFSSMLTVVQPGLRRIDGFYVRGSIRYSEEDPFHVVLEGSQDSMVYRLLRDGIPVREMSGTGDMLVFENVEVGGRYMVQACCGSRTKMMSGWATGGVSTLSFDEESIVEEISYTSGNLNKVERTHYDGFGRVFLSETMDDRGERIVSRYNVYNSEGQLYKSYLPAPVYLSSPTDTSASMYELEQYYWEHFSDAVIYSLYDYRGVPDDYVAQEWRPTLSYLFQSNMIAYEYEKNLTNDRWNLKRFVLDGTSLRVDGNYPEQSLRVEIVYGPEGNNLFTYYDGDGRLVAVEDNSGYCTHYVYDDLGLLRYVVTPEADAGFGSGARTLSQLRKYCYYYEYDEHRRVYKKYLPGSEPVIYLYDKRGRLALVQDGNMREGGRWLFTKYDLQNRPVMTGFCVGTESEHKARLAGATSLYETFDGDGLSPGASHYYTNVSYPTRMEEVLTVNYYDHYGWADAGLSAFVPGHALGGGMVWGVGGRQTGARERVIKEDGSLGGWLTTTYYYNDEGQLLQEIREHYGNVKEYKSYAYDLREQVTRFRVRQLMAGVPVVEYDRYFTYDEEGRVLKVEQEMADDGQGRVVLAEHVYNELGQLESKGLHNGGDVLSYGYDLNGRLLRTETGAFSYYLGYEEPLWNERGGRVDGNITEMRWKYGDGLERGYVYSYDDLQRLESADFLEGGQDASGGYNVEGVGYDLNGNLRRLLRRDGSGGVLHDLTYSYGNGANGNAVSGVRNGATVSSAYAYDANGNMIYDGMRELGVGYNYLNLPCEVGDVSYVYSTGGRKLGMEVGGVLTLYCGEVVYHGNPTEPGESNALLVRHPEGFVKANFWGAKEYYYTLRDHLGSTRAVRKASVGGALSTVQRTEYYPFGLAFSYDDLDENKYLFSGKELQDAQEGGEMLNLYDFGARFYDPVLGRWMTKDPMEEEYYWISAYAYCLDNPLAFVDLDGEDVYGWNPKLGKFVLLKKTDDDYDEYGVLRRDKETGEYSLQTNKKGQLRGMQRVEKGILRNGLDMKNNHNVFEVGGAGGTSIVGFQKFIVGFSDLVRREIAGYYYTKAGESTISYIHAGKYVNNKWNESTSGSIYQARPDLLNARLQPHTSWHTHPSYAPDGDRLKASEKDLKKKANDTKDHGVKVFIILTEGYTIHPLKY